MIEENNHTEEKFIPAEELIVEDVETLKVMADPLRLRLMELLVKPRTVKQIAATLDIPPTKLYYHVNLLEKHDLIRVVDTRVVSGIIEKQYQVVAKAFRAKKGLLSPGSDSYDDSMESTLSGMFDRTIADIIHSAREGLIDETENAPECLALNLYRYRLRLDQTQAEDFRERLHALLDEFRDLSRTPENEDAQAYRFLYVMYPTARGESNADNADEDIDAG
jgi:DNA-binding transcriptional ArsR family regulator